MQEPQRLNLYNVLVKNMKTASRKTYLHRIIYVAHHAIDQPTQDGRAFIILLDSNIKLINEDYCQEVITGLGLFYTGYFINMVEGAESTLIKHLRTLLETFEMNLSKTPEITRMKILYVSHHINRRYFSTWYGCQATPPVLLEKIEPSSAPEVNSRYIQNCVLKLYRVSEYLRNQPPTLMRAALDNISELCRPNLPEVNLLDFLLDSKFLLDVKEFVQIFLKVPDYIRYHETVWPLTPHFVPYNILEDTSTFLASKETKRISVNIKEVDKTGKDNTEEN